MKTMLRLLKLVAPLWWIMTFAIILGTIGHLCAIFVSVVGAKGIAVIFEGFVTGYFNANIKSIIIGMFLLASLRGVFHYGEQYCNHYIAFRLLALVRQKVFEKIRSLGVAKLDGKDKGNLITMITSDIELLEVFFAHTISPAFIAFFVSVIMSVYIGRQNILSGVIALVGYIIVGIVIPVINGKLNADKGFNFRKSIAGFNDYVLSRTQGIEDIIQYSAGNITIENISRKSEELGKIQKELTGYERSQRYFTNLVIYSVSILIFIYQLKCYSDGLASFEQVLTTSIATISSFGPVVALASLSNGLSQTLACGKRIINLMDEEPENPEVTFGVEWEPDISKENIVETAEVSFGYDEQKLVVDNKTVNIKNGQILGIHGPSGCGKSTFLRLLMGFWKPNKGMILCNDVKNKQVLLSYVKTSSLRDNQSLVLQETWIATDTIANNIAIGKLDATMDEIIDAAKKANIHDFIMGLENGYETIIGNRGYSLSEGEKQRIGVARAFLCDAPMMLLDEPTSALDALNEGIILKSLKNRKENQTIVLVSHRQSTMRIADEIIEFG